MKIKDIVEKYQILQYPNVVGYSSTLKPKIVKGKETETLAIRIYVSKKLPLEQLKLEEVVPQFLMGNNGHLYETDIVEVGEIEALSVNKTKKIRPVPLGVSIGNWSITTGSLGCLYRYRGSILAGTNAHVITDSPEKNPKEVVEKRILQPGPYHGGLTEDNLVGYYFWHKKIYAVGESDCRLANGVCACLNFLAKLFRRKGRFSYYAVVPNNIDFGVYRPTVEHIGETADGSLKDEPFIGHIFAGSPAVGVICKAKYIVKEGFIPIFRVAEPSVGDTVAGSSFWCSFKTKVLDDSANVRVGYGSFTAYFEDTILVKNDGTIKGGWSGSGWRLIK